MVHDDDFGITEFMRIAARHVRAETPECHQDTHCDREASVAEARRRERERDACERSRGGSEEDQEDADGTPQGDQKHAKPAGCGLQPPSRTQLLETNVFHHAQAMQQKHLAPELYLQHLFTRGMYTYTH